jgi:hypothetical protein
LSQRRAVQPAGDAGDAIHVRAIDRVLDQSLEQHVQPAFEHPLGDGLGKNASQRQVESFPVGRCFVEQA